MKKAVLSIIGIIVLVCLGGLIFFYAQISAKASDNEETKMFTIESGQGVKEISANLKEAGLSKSDFIFQTYIWLKQYGSKIQAGDYYIPQNLRMTGLVKMLISGEALSTERIVKIIEGWASTEISQYMAEFAVVDGNYTESDYIKEFLDAVDIADSKDLIPEKTYDFLADKPSDQGLEGYLFPDTYRIFKNSDPTHLIEKMLDNFDVKLTKVLRDEITAQGKTIYDVVTLASIVEHEVLTLEDKKIAAGIFYTRMENGIPLESDATVNYVTGKSELQPTFADTEIDNPYNTYENRGLPPGPISNPGLDSIMAVIYPEVTDYLYFLTKPDGTTVFSKTFEEHLANKAKYLD
ncbi:endolytic transglycosylase MltG [Patescibacteria group bacterium]|nr:endolytic transglycosylase MltG [Patescibacteria group bacterium]